MNLNPVLTKFLNKQNLKLLWEVLLDELHIDSNNKSIITNIRTVFESNIQPFTKNTSINTNKICPICQQSITAKNDIFYKKYLKYKNKYLQLKKSKKI